MSLILNVQGLPEVPSDVLARLRALDPTMGLVFLPVMGQFAITRAWRPDDPRRAAVQRGEFHPGGTYDVVGYLPVGCSADDAAGYAERGFRRALTAEDVDRMVDEVQAESDANNEALLEKAAAPVLDDINSVVGRRITNTPSSLDVKPAASSRKQQPSKKS